MGNAIINDEDKKGVTVYGEPMFQLTLKTMLQNMEEHW